MTIVVGFWISYELGGIGGLTYEDISVKLSCLWCKG